MSLGKIGIIATLVFLVAAGLLLYLDHPGRALQLGNYALVTGIVSSFIMTFSNSDE